MKENIKKYKCSVCGYIYDPGIENSDNIPSETPFEDLPEDWMCPICGASKKDFIPED